MPELYPLDYTNHEVAFNARPNSEKPLIVYHRLRRPTLGELQDREKMLSLELVENGREEQIITHEEAANANLWDKIVTDVKGYKGFDDWAPLGPQEKASVRPSHKSMAIRAMYLGSASIVSEEDEVSLTANNWTVRHVIGADPDNPLYEIFHTLREPSQIEQEKFKRTASKTSFIRGAKTPRTKIAQDLRAYVELYDALILGVSGATVGGKVWEGSYAQTHVGAVVESHDKQGFISAIDPVWKRMVVQTLMSTIDAALLD